MAGVPAQVQVGRGHVWTVGKEGLWWEETYRETVTAERWRRHFDGDLVMGRRNMRKRRRVLDEEELILGESYLIASLKLLGCRIENAEKGRRYQKHLHFHPKVQFILTFFKAQSEQFLVILKWDNHSL